MVNSLKCKIDLLIVFVVIVISEDTVLFGTNSNSLYVYVRYAIYLLLYVALLRRNNSFCRYTSNLRFYATIFIVSICGIMVINSDYRMGYVLQMLLILLSVEIVSLIQFHRFAILFSRIVYFLSVCSIVVTTLYMFIPSVFVYFPTISNYADVTFYNLYISVVFASVDVIRNTGIFREPGVFMIYLTFALMLELFFFKKRDIRNIIVFVIALLLTKSTAGYIITFLLLGFKYLFYSKLKYLPFFFVIILCFVIFLFPHIEEEVFSKLDEDNCNYLSTLSRISSVVLPIQMWLDNPFYGIGLGHFSSLYSIYAMKEFGMDFRSDSSSTNTILNTITIYGWWIGVMVVYGMYKTTYCFVNQKNILLLLIFLLLFSNEEMRNSLFYNLLVAYGFASKNDNRILKNELCFLR